MPNFHRTDHCLIFCICLLLLFSTDVFADEPDAKPTIRNISIEIRDIFSEPGVGGLYSMANQAKISTKEEVVRRELLFAEGEPLDQFLIDESERNLRKLPFLRQVSITPIAVEHGKRVDVMVRVQDTWTLVPQLSYSTGGGTNKTELGLSESDFLGYGKRLEAFYADDEGREKIEGVWEDQRLFGTQQRLLLGNFIRSDGYRSVFYYGHPFRSLTEKNSWNFNGDFSDTVGRLFQNGDERFIYRDHHQEFETEYVIAAGNPEETLHRLGVGYGFTSDEFTPADDGDFRDVNVDPTGISRDPSLLASDRRFSGPYLSYNRIEPDFISINYIDRFERVEDFNLGNNFSEKVQFAGQALDSLRDTLLISVSDSEGLRFSPTAFLRGEIGAGTRADIDGFHNSLFRAELKYFHVLGAKYLGDIFLGKHTLIASCSVDYGNRLDKDREFLLGAASGLRGYKSRTFTGDKRAILNIEERVHLVDDVFRLVSLGGAVFFDAGGTTKEGFGEVFTSDLYTDAGIGLRIGFPRSSGGGIARLDIAFPLRDGPDGTVQFEPRIVFTTGPPFGARLRSENVGPENASVTVGLDR